MIPSLFSTWFKRPPKIPKKWQAIAIKDTPILAIDLELTSLDTGIAKITSIAWIAGNTTRVDLNTAYYNIIRTRADLQQSPVIHGLTAKDLAKGLHIKTAVALLTQYADTHVWVLHNASLDIRVLNKVAIKLGIPKIDVVTFDTMLVELYFLNKSQGIVKQNSLTLENCRKRYSLPNAPNHNALDDALATLSLAFAQWYKFDKNGNACLLDLLHTKALKVYTIGIDNH